jgi:hypothetical protein
MGVKLAVTTTPVWAPIVTLHVPVPVQAPDQPVKVDPSKGVAFKVTEVPSGYSDTQLAGQSIPAGTLVTDPPAYAGPLLETRSVFGMCEIRVKVAVAVVITPLGEELARTLQVPVPVQAYDQPLKADPAAGFAVKVTGAPQG